VLYLFSFGGQIAPYLSQSGFSYDERNLLDRLDIGVEEAFRIARYACRNKERDARKKKVYWHKICGVKNKTRL